MSAPSSGPTSARGPVTRARATAEARAAVLRSAVGTRIRQLLPGATVREDGDGVTVTGRGLVRRWIGANALRDWREMER